MYKLAEEIQAEIEVEYCATQQSELEMPKEIPETLPEPEPPVKTWQEISQSPEYQALSESDKLKRQWEYLRETPEYKDMWNGDKVAVQLEFARKIREAERLAKAEPKPEPPKPVKQKGQQQETRKEPPKPVEHEQLTFDFKFEDEPAKPEPPKPQEPKPCGIVIYVPRHDDGLDHVGDIRL